MLRLLSSFRNDVQPQLLRQELKNIALTFSLKRFSEPTEGIDFMQGIERGNIEIFGK